MDLASSYIIRSRSRVIEILDGTKIERTRGDNDRERRTDITVFFVIFAIFFSAYATVTLHRTKSTWAASNVWARSSWKKHFTLITLCLRAWRAVSLPFWSAKSCSLGILIRDSPPPSIELRNWWRNVIIAIAFDCGKCLFKLKIARRKKKFTFQDSIDII